jgi:hypothetical protein
MWVMNRNDWDYDKVGGRTDQGLTRSREREEERSELSSRQVGLDKDDGRGV